VVQGATVVVSNVDTGFERTVTSNSDGFFTAPLLPLGKYRVSTEAAGFTKSILEGIELSVGQTLSLKIDLKIGGAVETIDVTSEGVGVETSRTELNTLIDERAVENLPISRRDFSKFV
ncbi:MAG: carboxypeptidase-like regulatory domain-containing protein, partial [Pyrinomonadaceae bacterium]